MHITFWGATETVTGSRAVVEAVGRRVQVDCGLYQGVKRQRLLNWQPAPVEPASIDAVVLTHAHLDHSGALPVLVRDGFDGPVWCSRSTADLAEILLLDAAHLQEEDARLANRRGSSKHRPALALFTRADADRALGRLRPVPFGSPVEVADGIEATLTPAGHILGAASVRLEAEDRTALFSGDLGRSDDVVMRPPQPPPGADHIVVESTYGNRLHPEEDTASVLADVVVRTVGRGGTVLVPVFAVGRAQAVLHLLVTLRAEGRIPPVPIALNSPMACDSTELFLASRHEHHLDDGQVRALTDGVDLVRSVDESMQLTARGGPMVVLSASGMLAGGRVLHHLVRVGPDRRSTIVLAGYQAAGTRGEALLAGARTVRVFGEDVPVRAEVVALEGLSAHADADELVAWLRSSPRPPGGVSVVHGEPAAADALRRRVANELGWPAWVPGRGESVEVVPAGSPALAPSTA